MSDFKRGQMAPAATLESPELLRDVSVPEAKLAQAAAKLYRCGIRGELGFQAVIHVAGITFASQTFKWDGSGESARQREFSCAFQKLTDDDIAKLKAALPFQYIRRSFGGDRVTVVGVEHVDASDGGDATVVPPRPAKLVRGRLQGDEEPLIKYLIFEPVSEASLPREGKELTKEELELRHKESVASENEDMLHPDKPGGRSFRDQIRRQLATGTSRRKPEAGVLEG